MHNIWLIATREYLERVRTKAFLISTILIPVLMGGGIVGSIFMDSKTKSTSHITIVSPRPAARTRPPGRARERQGQPA